MSMRIQRSPVLAVCISLVLATIASCSGGGSSGEQEDLIYVSASCTEPSGMGGIYCSLDEAIEAASTRSNPVLILSDGDYTLSSPITRLLTIRSEGYSASASASSSMTKATAPSSALTCVSTGAIIVPSLSPTATIVASGDETSMRVAMDDPSHSLKLEGVRSRALADHASILVTSGKIVIDKTEVTGPLIVTGESSIAEISSSILSPAEMTESPRTYGSTAELGHDIYTSALDCDEDAEYRAALIINDGASFVAKGMDINDHVGIGVCVDGASAIFCDSQIHDIQKTTYDTMGRAAYVTNGGSLTFKRTSVYDCYEVGILAEGTQTSLALSDGTEISGVGLARVMGEALGVVLQKDAKLTMSDSSIEQNFGVGLYMASGSTASVESSEILGNRAAGIATFSSTLSANGVSISNTTIGSNNWMGVGIFMDNTDGASTITIAQSTLSDNYVCNVYIIKDGSFTMTDSAVTGAIAETTSSVSLMGQGLFADGVCSDIVLTGSTFEGNEGVHIFLDDSNATLSTGTYVPRGSYDFVQQECTNPCIVPHDLTSLYAAGFSSSNMIALCGTPLFPLDKKTFTLYLIEGEITE
jgi:hypothetical protein